MFTNLFLDTTQMVNVVDSVTHVVASVVGHDQNLKDILKTLTALVSLTMPFIFSLVVIIIVFNNKFKKDKLRAEERMKMIEKGIRPPFVEEKKSQMIIYNNGKPIAIWIKLFLGFGAGLFFGMILERLGFNDSASYWSMIFVCMGVMLIFGDGILGMNKKQHIAESEFQTQDKLQENQQEKSIVHDNKAKKQS